jgi:hypothetical protein
MSPSNFLAQEEEKKHRHLGNVKFLFWQWYCFGVEVKT